MFNPPDYIVPQKSYTQEELEAAVLAERERAVQETNRRANASWGLMCEKMVAIEREACAKVCEVQYQTSMSPWLIDCAAAIRSRSDASK